MTEYTAHTCISRQVDGAHTAHRAMGKTQTRRCKCLVQLYLYQVNIARGIWCHTSYEPCLGLPRCSELLSAYYLMPWSGYLCAESIPPCLCEGCGLFLENAHLMWVPVCRCHTDHQGSNAGGSAGLHAPHPGLSSPNKSTFTF